MTPIEPAADDVFLVGDPRRAFALAQELMVQPRMSHQARGLWGYRGATASGREITVQSTGSGGPSAVSVISDLATQGATRMIRLGTCEAIDSSVKTGEVILVEQALAFDGTTRNLVGTDSAVVPDPDLLDVFDGVGRRVLVASHDLVLRLNTESNLGADEGAVASDLQTAATLGLCQKLSIPAAAILIVAEDQSGRRLNEEELWEISRDVGNECLRRLEL